jgi:hypothetical protein
MTDEQARIRSYLTSQGAKLAPAAIVEKVQAAMAELRAAALAVPPTRFAERPKPGEWSGNEVLAHVLAAGAYFGGAITAILDGGPPPPRLSGPGVEGAPLRTAEAWLALLERDRDTLFRRVLAADPDRSLPRTVEHPMFGPLEWRAALLFMRLHDLDHAGQLRQISAALA